MGFEKAKRGVWKLSMDWCYIYIYRKRNYNRLYRARNGMKRNKKVKKERTRGERTRREMRLEMV